MSKFLRLLLFPFSIISLSSHGQVKSKAYSALLDTLLSHSISEISAEKAASLEGKVVFLDARESKEYAISQIENAMLVGYDNFDITSVKDINKESQIIVYCSVGYRSEKIAEQLVKNGYTNVSNLYGGIFEWKNQGFEVYDDSTITNKLHAFSKTWGIWLNKGEKVY